MDLSTRCPQCGTEFTASLEQLQLRKGYIRCISCAHIFDGYDAVVSGNEGRAAAVSPTVTNARPTSPGPDSAARDTSAAMPSVLRHRQTKNEPAFTVTPLAASDRRPSTEPARPAFSISNPQQISKNALHQDPVFRMNDTDPGSLDHVAVRGDRPEPVLGTSPTIVAHNEPHISGLPQAGDTQQASSDFYVEPRTAVGMGHHRDTADFSDVGAPRYRSVAKVFWSALAVAGLLLLLAQLAYVYRAQIAHQIPAFRPLLTEACAQLNCKVAYSRRIDLISIMSSSLRATAKPADAAADAINLQFTLRNTYDSPQEWPTLVLDLTDFSGTLVVRKNLPPSSYLTPEALRQPFAASSEISLEVPIALNGLKINGYQLGKFFP